MINTPLKITTAIILTGVIGLACAQRMPESQCKEMAKTMNAEAFKFLHQQGECLKTALDQIPAEVEERRQVKANAKPDLSKMSPVTIGEKDCIRSLYANEPMSKFTCREPESYYRDLMSGKVKSKGLESEANQASKPDPYRDCVRKYQPVDETCRNQARSVADGERCTAALEKNMKTCRQIHLGQD